MQSLGEMSTWYSSSGAFERYATRYVSPSFGFAQGGIIGITGRLLLLLNLWLLLFVMNYWLPDVPSWVWSAIFLSFLLY